MLTENQLRNYWRKVDKKEETECWNWKSPSIASGYGVFKFNSPREQGSAHRVAAYIAGLIPSIRSLNNHDYVLHTCDNKLCQNPAHFFIGDASDNNRDKSLKGRAPKGETHKNSKLTEKDVVSIRDTYLQGGITHQRLADIYGVCNQLICMIINRRIWRHV